MVRPQEPHHFEGEGFGADVLLVPERDRKINLPNGERVHPGDNPVEWCDRRPQLGPRDAHVIKHRRIEHIDPTSPIDQDLVDFLDLNRGATTSG
jgi:hypothetical protein